jgi:hypothetical protein
MVKIKYYSVDGHYGYTSLQCDLEKKDTIIIAIENEDADHQYNYQSVSIDVDTAIKLQKHLKRLIAEIKGANNGE